MTNQKPPSIFERIDNMMEKSMNATLERKPVNPQAFAAGVKQLLMSDEKLRTAAINNFGGFVKVLQQVANRAFVPGAECGIALDYRGDFKMYDTYDGILSVLARAGVEFMSPVLVFDGEDFKQVNKNINGVPTRGFEHTPGVNDLTKENCIGGIFQWRSPNSKMWDYIFVSRADIDNSEDYAVSKSKGDTKRDNWEKNWGVLFKKTCIKKAAKFIKVPDMDLSFDDEIDQPADDEGEQRSPAAADAFATAPVGTDAPTSPAEAAGEYAPDEGDEGNPPTEGGENGDESATEAPDEGDEGNPPTKEEKPTKEAKKPSRAKSPKKEEAAPPPSQPDSTQDGSPAAYDPVCF